MALFTTTSFGYLVRIGDQDQLSGSYMRDEEDDSNRQLMYNMLMWELDGQMIKMEQMEKDKSVDNSGGAVQNSAANYSWLEQTPTPNTPKTTIPKRLKQELENMGRKIKPVNTNDVIKRFRDKLLGSEPPVEEVPLVFSAVLRTVVSEQVTEERRRMLNRPFSVVSRVMQSLHRTNRVGVMDIESCSGGVINGDVLVDDTNELPSSDLDPTRWAFTCTNDRLDQNASACQNDDYFIGLKNSDGGTTVSEEGFASDMDIVELAENIV